MELVDAVARDPAAGHRHAGLETATIGIVGDWLDARVGAARTTAAVR